MTGVLIAAAALGFLGWRFARFVLPAARWLMRAGDELGGWTTVYVYQGDHIKGAVTRSARWMLYGLCLIVALVWKPARWAVLAWLVVKVWRRLAARSANASKLDRSGFSSEAELKVVSDAVAQAFQHISSAVSRLPEGDIVGPRLYGWRKRPVRIGRRTVKGEWRYECTVEPAPGKSIAQLADLVGHGLDADDDRLRDSVNSMLRAARGRDVTALRRSGDLPVFVLSTLQQVTKRGGGKIGLGRLALWTFDPFAVSVGYPYDPSKPVIRHFTDPVPVGVLRSNAETHYRLDMQSSVQGTTGSGKSSQMRPVLVAAAHLPDVVIIVMALKGDADYSVLAGRFAGGTVITDPRRAAAVLVAAHTEIKRRNHLPKDQRGMRVLIVLDEGQELNDDIAYVVPVVKLGRSAGVHLHLVTQYGITSIVPSEAAREMGQREAGRIEGTLNQAQVAVGARATKTAGPHLIPPGDRWVGVLFGADGYKRIYWTTEEGPTSHLGRCAAACPPRPPDPPWFLDALAAPVDDLPAIELATFPEDGSKRAPSGEVRSFEVGDLPDAVREAVRRVWSVSGKLVPVHGHITRAVALKAVEAADKRLAARAESDTEDADPDDLAAVQLVSDFLARPIGATT